MNKSVAVVIPTTTAEFICVPGTNGSG